MTISFLKGNGLFLTGPGTVLSLSFMVPSKLYWVAPGRAHFGHLVRESLRFLMIGKSLERFWQTLRSGLLFAVVFFVCRLNSLNVCRFCWFELFFQIRLKLGRYNMQNSYGFTSPGRGWKYHPTQLLWTPSNSFLWTQKTRTCCTRSCMIFWWKATFVPTASY